MLNKLKKSFLILTGVVYTSYASESIANLLTKYQHEADLSKETRKESLGHVIVFSREDLDTMQAYTLKDVLKTLPMFNYGPNRFGVISLANSGEIIRISTFYRLYINDHEISSIHTYSPFLTYDEYPLDNIDHIEIYFALGAISVSSEPSELIIKMYTKKPERENASYVKAQVDSQKSYLGSIFSAKPINENVSYLFTANTQRIHYKHIKVRGEELNRDQLRYHTFLQVNYKGARIDSAFSWVKRGIMSGFSADGQPEEGLLRSITGYISYTNWFLDDKSLKLTLSYDRQYRKVYEKNRATDGGIFYPLLRGTGIITKLDENNYMDKFAFALDKTIKDKKNELLIGTFWRYYNRDLDSVYVSYNGLPERNEKDNPVLKSYLVKYFRIFSFYLENKYNFTPSNLLTVGARLDDFKFQRLEEKRRLNSRIGYISRLNKNFMIKGFISQTYILPSMFEIEASADGELDDMEVISYTAECFYTKDKDRIGLFIGRYEIENPITFDRKKGGLTNANDSISGNSLFIRWTHHFNFLNKVRFYAWYSDSSKHKYYSPHSGASVMLFNNFKSWYIYNELIYKSSFNAFGMHLDDSWNYSFGISKSFINGWKLSFKAENLFDNSFKVIYKPAIAPPIVNSAYDRRFKITLQKVF